MFQLFVGRWGGFERIETSGSADRKICPNGREGGGEKDLNRNPIELSILSGGTTRIPALTVWATRSWGPRQQHTSDFLGRG